MREQLKERYVEGIKNADSFEYGAKLDDELRDLSGIKKVTKDEVIDSKSSLDGGERVSKAKSEWQEIQSIKNKYPDEALPSSGALWGTAKIENGLIQKIGNKGNTFKDVDFVITKSGELKIGKKHHFLGNANEVEAAGTLKIVKGKIKKISNHSGHYFPSVVEAENYPKIFRQLGIDTKDVSLEIVYENAEGQIKFITKLITE